jgi:sulfite reductase alpha subunit-like flavoprotein
MTTISDDENVNEEEFSKQNRYCIVYGINFTKIVKFVCRKYIYIAYGSHTGNGESLVKSFANELTDDFGLHVKHSPLNDLKDIDLKDKAICIIIVCSVCGTGDCPENADNWWRWIKARSQV